MGENEASRCKRCDNWVYDGSPLCPNCLKRHNQVYNHSIEPTSHFDHELKSNNLSWLKLVWIVLIVLFISRVIVLSMGKKNTIDIASFPRNAQVVEFDEVFFSTQTISSLRVDTDTDYGYYIKVVDVETNHSVISFFLHPNSQYELRIPTGSYRLYYGLGKEWINYEEMFGKDGLYFKSNFIYIFTEKLGYKIKIKNNGVIEHDDLKISVLD